MTANTEWSSLFHYISGRTLLGRNISSSLARSLSSCLALASKQVLDSAASRPLLTRLKNQNSSCTRPYFYTALPLWTKVFDFTPNRAAPLFSLPSPVFGYSYGVKSRSSPFLYCLPTSTQAYSYPLLLLFQLKIISPLPAGHCFHWTPTTGLSTVVAFCYYLG